MTTDKHPTSLTSPTCHSSTARQFPDAHSHYTWTPEIGTQVTFETPAIPADQRTSYMTWVSNAFLTASHIDQQMQERTLDLPGRGLTPFLIPEEATIGWVPRGTELTFATPYLTPQPATAGRERNHCTHALHLWAVPDYIVGTARWDDPASLSTLVNKMHNPDAVLVEIALTNSDIITAARREYEAIEAAHELSETLTRADHVPYTRVAKKIKEATRGGVCARVYPITFPNTHHVPAVAITRIRYNETAIRDALTRDGFTALPTATGEPSSSSTYELWVKHPALFPEDSPQSNWLNSQAREATRYYSAARYASA